MKKFFPVHFGNYLFGSLQAVFSFCFDLFSSFFIKLLKFFMETYVSVHFINLTFVRRFCEYFIELLMNHICNSV